jgi:hypothetical protein
MKSSAPMDEPDLSAPLLAETQILDREVPSDPAAG